MRLLRHSRARIGNHCFIWFWGLEGTASYKYSRGAISRVVRERCGSVWQASCRWILWEIIPQTGSGLDLWCSCPTAVFNVDLFLSTHCGGAFRGVVCSSAMTPAFSSQLTWNANGSLDIVVWVERGGMKWRRKKPPKKQIPLPSKKDKSHKRKKNSCSLIHFLSKWNGTRVSNLIHVCYGISVCCCSVAFCSFMSGRKLIMASATGGWHPISTLYFDKWTIL